MDLSGEVGVHVVLIKVTLHVSLAVSRALSSIELLAVEPAPSKYLVKVLPAGRSTRTSEFFHSVDVRIVKLIVVHSGVPLLDVAAVDVVIAQAIVRYVDGRVLGRDVCHALIEDHATALSEVILG